MPEIAVDVGGRSYRLICGQGEEEHLTELARLIDAEAKALSRGRTQMAADRLMLMSALMVADRLYEAEKRVEELEAELAKSGGGDPAREAELAERLSSLAERAEALTPKASGGGGNGRARR